MNIPLFPGFFFFEDPYKILHDLLRYEDNLIFVSTKSITGIYDKKIKL